MMKLTSDFFFFIYEESALTLLIHEKLLSRGLNLPDEEYTHFVLNAKLDDVAVLDKETLHKLYSASFSCDERDDTDFRMNLNAFAKLLGIDYELKVDERPEELAYVLSSGDSQKSGALYVIVGNIVEFYHLLSLMDYKELRKVLRSQNKSHYKDLKKLWRWFLLQTARNKLVAEYPDVKSFGRLFRRPLAKVPFIFKPFLTIFAGEGYTFDETNPDSVAEVLGHVTLLNSLAVEFESDWEYLWKYLADYKIQLGGIYDVITEQRRLMAPHMRINEIIDEHETNSDADTISNTDGVATGKKLNYSKYDKIFNKRPDPDDSQYIGVDDLRYREEGMFSNVVKYLVQEGYINWQEAGYFVYRMTGRDKPDTEYFPRISWNSVKPGTDVHYVCKQMAGGKTVSTEKIVRFFNIEANDIKSNQYPSDKLKAFFNSISSDKK